MVCNMYVIYNQVNVHALFDHYHIVLNCTAHFVHSPLNSYFIYIGYWTLNIYFYNFIIAGVLFVALIYSLFV